MDLKLKICGMRDPDNIDQVALLQPDYLGLIFFEGSPRFVKNEIRELEQAIKKTGVFVNASKDFILEKVSKYALSAVQLHGEESSEFCTQLKNIFSKAGKNPELIKVFSVKEEFNFELLEAYEGIVDLFLFDTKGKSKGGNGITFNWKLLKDYPSPTPFFLSGGIGPEEIPAIKSLYEHFQKKNKQDVFFGVDVNSRFETAPGLKNVEKLKTFRKDFFTEA